MSDRLRRLEADVAAAGGRVRPSAVRPLPAVRAAAERGESAVQRMARRAARPAARPKAEGQQADIPLDPGAGGRSIDTAALETADVIVSTTAAYVSDRIRAATNSPVSHAMLYVGDGMVVEAIGKGVVLRPLPEALADARVAVAFRRQGLTNEQQLRVRDAAGRRVGAGFDWVGIVRQARFQRDAATHCGGLAGEELRACRAERARVNFGTAENDRFFCSELVAAAFAEAGVPLFAGPPTAVAPGDIAELGSADALGYVGHLRTPAAGQQSRRVTWAASAPLPDLSDWAALISFRPPPAVVAGLAARGAAVGPVTVPGTNMRVLDLADAYGPINLDYYPVRVTRLPAGYPSAEDLLQHLRVNLGSFLDPRKTEFEPYEPADGKKFGTFAPVGAVMRFKLMAPLVGGNVDDGAVVCAEHSGRHWVFTTVWTPRDLGHPVSGNREWGYTQAADGGYVFYTRAADRATTRPEAAVGDYQAFPGGHLLWLDFQQRLARFVADNGGAADVGLAVSSRYPWDEVRAAYYRPVGP